MSECQRFLKAMKNGLIVIKKILLSASLGFLILGCQHSQIYYVPISGPQDKAQTTQAETTCKSKNLDASDLENIWLTIVKGPDKAMQECMASKGYKRIEKPKTQ